MEDDDKIENANNLFLSCQDLFYIELIPFSLNGHTLTSLDNSIIKIKTSIHDDNHHEKVIK